MSRESSGRTILIRIGIGLGILAAILILFLFIFKVRTIDVYGNIHHSSDEIASDLGEGFLDGNSLILLWKNRKNQVPENMPYLSSLNVSMAGPSHVKVTVTEKELAGCVDMGDYVYFDTDGVVLETSSDRYNEIPLITGMNTQDAQLYQKLPVEQAAYLRIALEITKTLKAKQENGSYHTAKEIRFSNEGDITVFIEGIQAEMGQAEALEEKIANLCAIMDTMSNESLHGILHLEAVTGSKDNTISFTPTEETEAPVEEILGGGVNVEVTLPEGSEQTPEGVEGQEGTAVEENPPEEIENYVVIDMVFNSSGTLVYNVHVSNGVVVDSYGNEVPGCYVNEDGNIVDAYMNTFSSVTGSLMNQ